MSTQLSLARRLRHRVSSYLPIRIPPRHQPGGLSLKSDLAQCGIRPSIIVDVGAHFGESSHEYACLWPEATIHAFEPSSTSFEALRKNTAGLRVVSHNVACSDEVGTASLHYQINDSGRSSLNTDHGYGAEAVATTTLDHAANQILKIDHIDFLKIDVEGHEMAVLRGARALLSRRAIQSILIEVGFNSAIHTPHQEVNAVLRAHGFGLISYHDQRAINGSLAHANALYVLNA